MDATTDKEPLVQEQIYNALCYLGEAEPEEILQCCDEYLRQHDKLAYPHRVIILKAMETVVKNNISSLDKSTAKAVIFLASNEMTKSKEVVWEWQQAASSVLVAVGQRFINKVMEEVLTKFQPGILPHYFVMQTFANLAVSNVFGMVPFLNSILGTMLPMLGMAKQDHMKSVFCYALQHFSESIQEYVANLDQAPDPTVRKDTFCNEIFSAYEVLFNSWLQHREPKLRLAVVEALGAMSYLMPGEKLEDQLPKLIPAVLSLYKKHTESFYISKSLCQILEASVDIGSRSLDVQLDALLGTLHPQICTPADPAVPLTVKNHTEVLRCFTVLACSFPDRVLTFLLPKLESSSERTRVGTLLIMRQIINSAPSQMEIKKPFILSSMRLPLQDSNNKVRRAVVQVISAMAHHGYLEQPGGEAMLEFLVRQCALPSDAPQKPLPDADDPTSDSVRSISVNTLLLLSTTVDRMNNVLWPYLLEFITPMQFTNALTPICKSLMHLSVKKREEGGNASLIPYDLNGNLPSPHALTTRLLVVSSRPYTGDSRGAAALRLLHALCCSVHPALDRLWSKRIPLLVERIEENTEKSLHLEEWEEELLLLLQETLAAVSDNAWICHFVTEMCRQLNGYNGFPTEKNFLYKCIGTTLGACVSKELVQKQLQELLETARYNEEAEWEGLASCFGICAINHLEETLAKLEDFVRSDVFKKSVGLFSIFKDRSDHEVEKIKGALILCYGFVAARAPRELLLSRVEADILRNISQYFSTKDLTLKLCLIRSIAMISRAVRGSTKCTDFALGRKAELMAQMVEFIKGEPLDSMRTLVRQWAMVTCTHLVLLEPPLSDPDRTELMDACLAGVLALPPLDPLWDRDGDGGDAPYSEELFADTLGALQELLKTLLQRSLTPHGLQDVFAHLGPWIKSSKQHERQRAVELSAALLDFYLGRLNVSVSVRRWDRLCVLMSSQCHPGAVCVYPNAVPVSSQGHPNAIPVPSQSHPNAIPVPSRCCLCVSQCSPGVIPVPSQCHPSAIPIPSQCHPRAIPVLSVCIPMQSWCHPSAIPMPSQCHSSAIPISSQCHPNPIPVPSQCHPNAIQCHPNAIQCHSSAIPIPSQCYPNPIPVPSQCHPSAIPMPSQCHPSAIPIPSQCYPNPIRVPSQCHPNAIPIPSQYHLNAIQCHPNAIPMPSQCHPGAIPVPSQCHPNAIPIPSNAIPVPSRCHPNTIPIPSQCHPNAIPVPSQSHPNAIPMPSQCHPGAIPIPSQCHLNAIPVPSQCHPNAIPVPSQCHPNAIPMPSNAIPVPSRCHPNAIPIPSQCHPNAIPVPSQSHPNAIPMPPQCHPGAVPIPSQCHPNAIPVLSQSHPNAIPIPSQSHPNAIPVLSQYHPNAIPVPSQSHPNAISMPSQCHSSTIPMPSQCHPNPIPMPSQCHPSAIPIPSQCHPNAIPVPSRCHPNPIPMPSQCHPDITPVLSWCCPSAIPMPWQCCPGAIPVPS
uniref:Maestro heat like repeat family member 1 n=1 Tax=Meleagris gallopavo TaxID=9103 RepID=A0A803XNT1_MELGA